MKMKRLLRSKQPKSGTVVLTLAWATMTLLVLGSFVQFHSTTMWSSYLSHDEKHLLPTTTTSQSTTTTSLYDDSQAARMILKQSARQWTVLAVSSSLEDDGDDSSSSFSKNHHQNSTTRTPSSSGSHQSLSQTLIVTRNLNNHPHVDVCLCEFVSVDCLDSMACMPSHHNQQEALVSMGVTTRAMIKQLSQFQGTARPFELDPIGKALQYTLTESWWHWRRTQTHVIPLQYVDRETMFLNATLHPECVQAQPQRIGKNCFFAPTKDPEDLGDLERLAVQNYPVSLELQQLIQADVTKYLSSTSTTHDNDDSSPFIPALGHLMSFAHFTRIRFQRTQVAQETYHRMVQTWNDPDRDDDREEESLNVALHIRRADSCSSQHYERAASPLDSPAQPTNRRKCYATSVYLKELERIQSMMMLTSKRNRRLHVYLSSDDSKSLLEEIQTNDPALYTSMTWHVLGYPDRSSIFQYQGSIEGNRHGQHNVLGETAVADLWLLSHGEVFVGHLGSRFGKMAYLLSTARYNRFIPYFSVDGKSYCCDVDEDCGYMKPYIRSMDGHCLGFSMTRWKTRPNKNYWDIGTLARKKHVLQEEELRYHPFLFQNENSKSNNNAGSEQVKTNYFFE